MFEIEHIEFYQTPDGKTFDTYESAEIHCYETMANDFKNEIEFFNRDGEPIEVECALANYNKIFFFIAHTNKGVELVSKYLRYVGAEFPEIEQGEMYRYDTTDDYWISSKEDIQNFNSLWKGKIKVHC